MPALGAYAGSVISFLLVSFAVFLRVRYIIRLRDPSATPDPGVSALKTCPFRAPDVAAGRATVQTAGRNATIRPLALPARLDNTEQSVASGPGGRERTLVRSLTWSGDTDE